MDLDVKMVSFLNFSAFSYFKEISTTKCYLTNV